MCESVCENGVRNLSEPKENMQAMLHVVQWGGERQDCDDGSIARQREGTIRWHWTHIPGNWEKKRGGLGKARGTHEDSIFMCRIMEWEVDHDDYKFVIVDP